jgi:toxin ParE1/3/4
MAKFVLSNKAEDDLAEIYRYGFLNFGERQANSYAEQLKEKCQNLTDNPLLYRERKEFNPPVRIGYHGKHLIIYTIEDGYILIVRILHGSMDVTCHFGI